MNDHALAKEKLDSLERKLEVRKEIADDYRSSAIQRETILQDAKVDLWKVESDVYEVKKLSVSIEIERIIMKVKAQKMTKVVVFLFGPHFNLICP